MSLEVLEPGWASRVVDLGRPATRRLGVPIGGAADRSAFVFGNALVGNPPEAAALEIGLTGPRLRALADLACVVFGAPFEMPLHPIGTTFTLRAGDVLGIGGTPRGMRAYLCVAGGIDAPLVLGSRSALDVLKRGDVLPCQSGTMRRRFARAIEPAFPDEVSLRVLPGLQATWFNGDEFFSQTFAVSPAGNRMGLRLQGAPLKMPKRELVSEPVAPGAVQVTSDGQCIVLGVDGQTIGGYPKIAHVIRADLDRLGQLRPGNRIRFSAVSPNEAEDAARRRDRWLREWVLRLRESPHASLARPSTV